jgi:hypothetical protein
MRGVWSRWGCGTRLRSCCCILTFLKRESTLLFRSLLYRHELTLSFVGLFLRSRQKALKDLLARQVGKDEEKEKFVVEKLFVPAEWIAEAKVRSLFENPFPSNLR